MKNACISPALRQHSKVDGELLQMIYRKKKKNEQIGLGDETADNRRRQVSIAGIVDASGDTIAAIEPSRHL